VYPENPVVARAWRGDWVESQHRGAWALVDVDGGVLAGRGSWSAPVFTRSAVKSLQALPMIESGAAEAFGVTDEELALCLASHNAEPRHTAIVQGFLARLGLGPGDLSCGPQPPGDPAARADLHTAGREPTALHNNCSGKHAGFLCLARHLGMPSQSYLDPAGPGQRLVRAAVAEMAGLESDALGLSIDGCSAPSFRLPLVALGRALARVATPAALPAKRRAACERMTRVVAAHPVLIAGSKKRLCTDLARVSKGRLFPKVGGDTVYAVGVRGTGQALAVRLDDSAGRGLPALVLALCERFGFLSPAELAELGSWRAGPLYNWAGIEVGRLEVLV